MLSVEFLILVKVEGCRKDFLNISIGDLLTLEPVSIFDLRAIHIQLRLLLVIGSSIFAVVRDLLNVTSHDHLYSFLTEKVI